MSELSTTPQKRLEYIDFIRGLAMLTIIFVHMNLYSVLPNWSRYFDSFQIFIFFFISGYLLKKGAVVENYPKWLEKQALRLLLPYFVFALVNNALNAVFYGADTAALIVNFFCANLYLGSIWFLPSLFLCAIVGGYAVRICKNDVLLLLIGVIALIGGVLVSDYIGYFLRIPQGLIGVFFYITGYLARKYEKFLFCLKWLQGLLLVNLRLRISLLATLGIRAPALIQK